METERKTLNKNFIVVFQPKQPELFGNRRRFAIGAGKLADYVGADNAKNLIENALNSTQDSYRRDLRKQGRVVFYCK